MAFLTHGGALHWPELAASPALGAGGVTFVQQLVASAPVTEGRAAVPALAALGGAEPAGAAEALGRGLSSHQRALP